MISGYLKIKVTPSLKIYLISCVLTWKVEKYFRLLAKFVGIEDYETTLFSSWVLRTILSHTSRVLDKMNQNDYKIFMLWLYEEINLLTENPGWFQFSK